MGSRDEARFKLTKSNFSAGHFVGDVIGREVGQMLRYTPVASLGTDPEGIHQLRVASRRLRSELRLLQPMLDVPWHTTTTKDLAWLGRTLGKYRDSDVLIALLEEFSSADPDLDRSVIGRATHDRQLHQRRIVRTLSRRRYVSLVVTLARSVIRPPLRHSYGEPAEVITSQLSEAWRALREASAGPIDSAANLHRIRILTKRARYVTEIATPFLDDGAHAIIERFVAIQDSLGHRRDLAAVGRYVTSWYDSPEAVRGVDPADARDVWLNSIDAARRVNPDAWKEPLAEVMVLIDDMHVPGS